jgi:hypothetical protein
MVYQPLAGWQGYRRQLASKACLFVEGADLVVAHRQVGGGASGHHCAAPVLQHTLRQPPRERCFGLRAGIYKRRARDHTMYMIAAIHVVFIDNTQVSRARGCIV